MTSAAHIHAKCSVTISEEKKNTLLLNTVRSAELSPKKRSITVSFAVVGSQEVTHQKPE